jgi:hypothetical protein
MTVFDDVPRCGTDSPDHNETAFGYLTRSGRTEADRVRFLVDTWFDHYPAAHRDALIARFRSSIDDQHKSAFFELFLHELVLTRGHKVLEIEPELTHTTKSPDFLVESRRGHRFYLEAVMATGRSQNDAAAQARLNQALTALDNTPSPAHFLDLSPQGTPTAPISINKMRRALSQWIAALAPDPSATDRELFVYDEHGLRITIRPFPRRNRQAVARSIGVRHFPVHEVTVDEDIRAALEKKASRYGDLDHPYVVAVNALGLFHHEDDAFDALLGTSFTAVHQFTDGTFRTEDTRKPDGIWVGPQGPRRKGLSAVLSTEQIDPWNFASRHGVLIRNPWATAVLEPISLGVDEFDPIDANFRKTEGSAMWRIFDLPRDWPLD